MPTMSTPIGPEISVKITREGLVLVGDLSIMSLYFKMSPTTEHLVVYPLIARILITGTITELQFYYEIVELFDKPPLLMFEMPLAAHSPGFIQIKRHWLNDWGLGTDFNSVPVGVHWQILNTHFITGVIAWEWES